MTGPREVTGTPQRRHVRLVVEVEGLSRSQHRLVSDHLTSLPGWKAGLFGDDRISLTYDANVTNRDTVVAAAIKEMSQVGVELPYIEAYTTWWVRFGLTRPMLDDSDPAFPHVTAIGANLGRRIGEDTLVLNASFEQPAFGAIIVETISRDELPPHTNLLTQIRLLIHQAETQ